LSDWITKVSSFFIHEKASLGMFPHPKLKSPKSSTFTLKQVSPMEVFHLRLSLCNLLKLTPLYCSFCLCPHNCLLFILSQDGHGIIQNLCIHELMVMMLKAPFISGRMPRLCTFFKCIVNNHFTTYFSLHFPTLQHHFKPSFMNHSMPLFAISRKGRAF
jgi:hypothetical protein